MTLAPYGSWASPITSALLVEAAVTLSEVQVDGDTIYWSERRPSEGGRVVVVRCDAGRSGSEVVTDAVPEGFNVRTTVHEYGGGAYMVHAGVLFFSNFDDQRIYRLEPGSQPVPITPEPRLKWQFRYADGRISPDGRWLVCVRETHPSEAGEARNEVVVVPTDGAAEPAVIATGHDFYAAPRLSRDGTRLAFLTWDHPRMPWDGTELFVVAVGGDGRPSEEPARVAGGPTESVLQPRWSPDGVLHYVSDRTGWWNLYTEDGTAVAPKNTDFGNPPWAFGQSTYSFVEGGIACIWHEAGSDRLGVIAGGRGQPVEVKLPSTNYNSIRSSRNGVVLLAGSPTSETAVVHISLASATSRVLRRSREGAAVDTGYLSVPEAIEFPTDAGTAHAFYYPPANKDFEGPRDERPPLLVISHGGPTGSTNSVLSLRTQYWTSRGIAVVDVNYGGSSGYGREYRRRLTGTWGITDVIDCINAARFLADRGDVDAHRLLIRGGSAGGYTTLCALTFHDVFAAGASHFGVADAEALARDTHKFESRYLDGLIGPYPEARDIYVERSPIHFADRISCPLILFQGLEDKIVPPAQSEEMAAALDKNGIPHAYVAFEGEQHGFRRAENIRRSFDAELYFYSRVLGFELAGDIAPVAIANLET